MNINTMNTVNIQLSTMVQPSQVNGQVNVFSPFCILGCLVTFRKEYIKNLYFQLMLQTPLLLHDGSVKGDFRSLGKVIITIRITLVH